MHLSAVAQEKAKLKQEQTFQKCIPHSTMTSTEWRRVIKLIQDAHLVDCKVYPLTLADQDELSKFIEENLKSGCIHLAKLPMASPFFFIKKKDSSLCPVQNYHKLNKMTVKNHYLLLIQELLDKLKGAQYFTKLDICWGYNNVCIKEGNE
ncbi:unnamed protein product [Peniophora sp. CBMAI 1063]|nr:unnamed protein product [Peniophora sp. CBMAI 1063]